jgi:Zn-dependent peptidase ImmA (M78 family)/DNA-binding XRE family transcriptional regulator
MAIGSRIRLARRIARMSQRELAAKAGVSAAAICKYEQNKDIPSSGVLLRLADALNLNVGFFVRPSRVQRIEPSFRKRQTLPQDEEAASVGRIQEWLERYLETEQLLVDEGQLVIAPFEFPLGFPRLVRSLLEVEAAARALRDAWQLGQDSVENLTELLELRGIKVGLVDAHRDFDACTFWVEAEERVPVIALRKDLPGDRQRFSLGHELAHLLLQFPADWEEDQKEKAAHRFASAFLLPAEAASLELGSHRHTLSLYELHLLKHKYGVSMQVWLYRAKDLGILSEEDAIRLLARFKVTDWWLKEPGDQFPPEAPTRLERLVMHALAEEVISERRASELLGRPFSQFSLQVAREHDGLQVAVCG